MTNTVVCTSNTIFYGLKITLPTTNRYILMDASLSISICRHVRNGILFLHSHTIFNEIPRFFVLLHFHFLQYVRSFKAFSQHFPYLYVPRLADSGFFFDFQYQGGVKLQFLGYLRTLSLKFLKATSKIEVFLCLPCWLSQFS